MAPFTSKRTETLIRRYGTMTKKDYIKFAAIFRTMRPTPDAELAHNLWSELLRQTVDVFASDNDRFNRATFLRASGAE